MVYIYSKFNDAVKQILNDIINSYYVLFIKYQYNQIEYLINWDMNQNIERSNIGKLLSIAKHIELKSEMAALFMRP